MAFKHYLLGILADKPMSGYSMFKFFYDPFGRPLSQIYRTLNKMNKEGLIEVERVMQDKLPSQNVYHITESGNSELMRWLKQPTPVKQTNTRDVLGKLWFGSKVDEQDTLKHLESFAKYVEKNLNFFKNQAKPQMEARAKEQGLTSDLTYRLLVIEYGVKEYETAVEWVRTALDKIKNIRQMKASPEPRKLKKSGTP